jgi:predicted RNA binding protein YcfA (HicA-like mRNA interferase family)
MSRREKLLDKMRHTPVAIRFSEVEALLRYEGRGRSAPSDHAVAEGFVLFNQRGSHCTYHRADSRVLTIVRPHEHRTTRHPNDIRKLLEALKR